MQIYHSEFDTKPQVHPGLLTDDFGNECSVRPDSNYFFDSFYYNMVFINDNSYIHLFRSLSDE